MTNAEYHKRFRDKRKSLNRCVLCGKQDERILSGYALCNKCAEKQRQYKQKLKEQHRCLQCGTQDERTLAGLCFCNFCTKKAKLLYRENKLHKNERTAQEGI